jgi:AbrB family looped-hinge helix DNA binding protein
MGGRGSEAADPRRDVLKVSAKGQLTLPKTLRKALGVAGGDYLVAYGLDDRLVVLEPMGQTPFGQIAGEFESMARNQKLTPSGLDDLIRRARKRLSQRRNA